MNRSEINRSLAKALAYADCGKFEEAQHWGEILIRQMETAAVFRAGSVQIEPGPDKSASETGAYSHAAGYQD